MYFYRVSVRKDGSLMGNIRIHVGLETPVEAPMEAWLTALMVSLPEGMIRKTIENLDRIKRQQLQIIKPTPGMNGKILMPK